MRVSTFFITFWGVVSAQITVDVNTKLQTIDGFGFSQAFGRARQFQDAPEATRQKALDLLFNTTTGAGFSIIRNRVGSGGAGDSILPVNPGSPSATPNYVWDGDDKGQVWLSKAAAQYGVQQIVATAWSAPGFMKTSGNEATAGYLCGSTGRSCSSGNWQQAYANLLAQYVTFYAQEGINITHLGFLNEPDITVSYSQMQISSNAQEAISFIPVLRTTLDAANHTTVQIICCDAAGWGMQGTYTNALVNSGATSRLGVITGHSYTSQPGNHLGQTALPKWNTEAGPDIPFITTWYAYGGQNEGHTWAVKIASAIVTARHSAYLFWQGFQLKNPNSAMHLIDALDGVNPTPSGIYWAFAMWSRYVRPGAQRVGVSGSLSGVISAAFVNTDGSRVVVLTSSSGSAQAINIAGLSGGEASAWVTDNTRQFATTPITGSGSSRSVSLPARSVVTIRVV